MSQELKIYKCSQCGLEVKAENKPQKCGCCDNAFWVDLESYEIYQMLSLTSDNKIRDEKEMLKMLEDAENLFIYFSNKKYAIDLVFCIDATSDMQCIINRLKESAPQLNQKFRDKMTDRGKGIDQLRVKVIAFRDYYFESEDMAMLSSKFFNLPEKSLEFINFISNIFAQGGGDKPESGLEALALAIQSPWETSQDFVNPRHIIALLTDAPAHPLEKEPKQSYYPHNIPKTFDDLTDKWDEMSTSTKRLLLFAPEVTPWSEIQSNWDNVIHFPSQTGMGLADFEIEEILDGISCSI